MNDLELVICLYRGLAEYARMNDVDSWNQKRLIVYTPVKQHGDYCFTCIVIKDLNLITTIPQLVTGTYDEVHAVINEYRNTPGVKVMEIENETLKTRFSSNYSIMHPGSNILAISGKDPLDIIASAIDKAFEDYITAMEEFVRTYPGNNAYNLTMLLPSWTYRTNTMYKPFGFNLFTSTSGIDVVHRGIEVSPNGSLQYVGNTQLSGEVVRCVKHDNIK